MTEGLYISLSADQTISARTLIRNFFASLAVESFIRAKVSAEMDLETASLDQLPLADEMSALLNAAMNAHDAGRQGDPHALEEKLLALSAQTLLTLIILRRRKGI